MARGSSQATGAATSAQNLSNVSSGNAGSLYSTLAPELSTEAANPQGFAPPDLAAMNTAAQESAGGTQAAATGAGMLKAARTRNPGSTDAAIDSSARGAGEIASKGALSTQIANTAAKEKERQNAMAGMGDLYGANAREAVGALGEVAPNVNADTNAENASWDWTKAVGALSGLAGATKKAGTGW